MTQAFKICYTNPDYVSECACMNSPVIEVEESMDAVTKKQLRLVRL